MLKALLGRTTDSKDSPGTKAPAPMVQQPSFFGQMQQRYGNQGMGRRIMNESVREMVSAGFGSDSVDIYDMWKLRKDPAKLDQFMQDRIHRMDGGFQ